MHPERLGSARRYPRAAVVLTTVFKANGISRYLNTSHSSFRGFNPSTISKSLVTPILIFTINFI